jgi:hypothetical protein
MGTSVAPVVDLLLRVVCKKYRHKQERRYAVAVNQDLMQVEQVTGAAFRNTENGPTSYNRLNKNHFIPDEESLCPLAYFLTFGGGSHFVPGIATIYFINHSQDLARYLDKLGVC